MIKAMKPVITWLFLLVLVMLTGFGPQQCLAAVTPEAETDGSISFYDKAQLNDPIMLLDMDGMKTGLDQHTYKVREGSIGGFDSAGGACGCN
jgi:hypothetical protein